MKGSLSLKEFTLFQNYIKDNCGIVIGEEKAYLIESRLTKLLIDSRLSTFEELYYSLQTNKNTNVNERVIDAITTNETLWFRDKTPWIIMEELILPKLIELLRTGTKNKIRMWSAASSTGQEAYSTVMCIDNYLRKNNILDINISDFEVLATDISQTVLDIAKSGRYDPISMIRGIDDYYKNTYFINEGRIWRIKDEIKNRVKFQKFNLQNSFISLGLFDVIFCRYVMIYFSKEFKEELLSKIRNSLEKEGVLFIGSSEIIVQHKKLFREDVYKNGIYYRIEG